MALFINEDGKQLTKKQIIVPDKLVKKLKFNKSIFGKYKDTKGFKRVSAIVDDDYNKRSDKKDRVHTKDKTISFSDLKRIDHDMRHMSPNPNNLEYVLQGGEEMKNWSHDALKSLRTSVKKVNAVPEVPKIDKNPFKNQTPQKVQNIKMGNANVTISESNKKNKNTVIISESHLKLLKEYHTQTVFNFDDNGEAYFQKNNWEHFIDFLEKIGHYGKLPKSNYSVDDVIEVLDSDFFREEIYFHWNEDSDQDDEYYIDLFLEFIKEHYGDDKIFTTEFLEILEKYEYDEYYAMFDYLKENRMYKGGIDFSNLLTRPYGTKMFYKYRVEHFFENLDDYDMFSNLKIDNRGLIFIERAITIPVFNSPNTGTLDYNDFYQMLTQSYNGVGIYWTWNANNSEAYCANTFGKDGYSTLILRAYVDPINVNWGDTVGKQCWDLRHEMEMVVKRGAPVEIFDIELEDIVHNEQGKSLDGSHLLKQPIIVSV